MTTPAATSLAAEAKAAYQAQVAAETAAADAARTALRTAATNALKAVLVRADGTRPTFADLGLTVRDSDVTAGRVVWSDGTTAVAAVLRDNEWRVHLVALVDGQWERRSDRLTSLADLGRALAAAKGA